MCFSLSLSLFYNVDRTKFIRYVHDREYLIFVKYYVAICKSAMRKRDSHFTVLSTYLCYLKFSFNSLDDILIVWKYLLKWECRR